MKSLIYLTIGKISLIVSKRKFEPQVKIILKIIKNELEKNQTNLNLEIFDCINNLLEKHYKNIVLDALPYEDFLTKIFCVGFSEYHSILLNTLLKIYPENSIEKIKIILVILNVISIIISDRKFYLKESLNYFKTFNIDVEFSVSKNLNDSNVSLMLPSSSGKKNKEFLHLPRKAITYYLGQIRSNNKSDEYKYTLNTSLKFLKSIDHEFFKKDILIFFQQYCLRYLEEGDYQMKENVINLANAPFILNSDGLIDNEIDYMMNIILDSFTNVILNESNEDLKLKMIMNLDKRYDRLLASNKFFNKITLILNYNDNNIKKQMVTIIGRILHYNYTTITIFIKKSILDIFNRLDLCLDQSEREDAIVLLNYYVEFAGSQILDYVELIFKTLIKMLKSYSNDTLNISILNILSELIKVC